MAGAWLLILIVAGVSASIEYLDASWLLESSVRAWSIKMLRFDCRDGGDSVCVGAVANDGLASPGESRAATSS